MKIPFYFKLRISAGMIENIIKQEIPHLSQQPLEALKWGIFCHKRDARLPLLHITLYLYYWLLGGQQTRMYIEEFYM